MVTVLAVLPGAAASGVSRGGSVVIDYPPTITVSAGADTADFRRLLDEHARDLMRIVERETRSAERLNY